MILSLGCAGLSGCSGAADGGTGNARERLIPAVEAVQARYGKLPLYERLSGKVKAKNQVELYPEVSAAVLQVYVENGELVRAGDPLVRLRATEFKEQLNQAEASLNIARAQSRQAEAEHQRMSSELGRAAGMRDKGLISATELESIETNAITAEANAELARARMAQAQATVDERKEELSRTILRAPFDGTVGDRHAEVGMLVSTSTRLFTIGQLDSMRVEVILTDRMLSYIDEGQRTEIFTPTGGSMALSAPVARISPFLHPVSHSTTAQIDLANRQRELKPGMFVTVDIFYGESEEATLVPLASLWENPSTASVGVFICRDPLEGETALMLDDALATTLTPPVGFEFVPVEVIAKARMSAGVRGVDTGDWLVTIGQDLLGADTATARVRKVSWQRVEALQQLQREDLLEKVVQRKSDTPADSVPSGSGAGERPALP